MTRCVTYSFLLLFCAACSNSTPLSTSNPTAPSAAGLSSVSGIENFRAHLNGDQVVLPLPIPTLAQGQAVFQLQPGGTELSYKVIASNIDNVVGAHLHLAAVGARGPLVALLLTPPPAPAGGRTDGVLVDGTLTANMLFGPLAGQPLSALIDAIHAGNVYVDVPTNDGVAPVNSGPGDYPGGELRGQVQ